eukprot:GHUV01029515.1.p3 GENE.GHUV01029515.1~~GHUV01029515.1.p3  ORF type:complete len:103 (-),score=11.92 GHUV01029515.1:382-690(-)
MSTCDFQSTAFNAQSKLPLSILLVLLCSESWDTFGYMTEQSHWNWAVQQSVRVAGAVLMWQIGSRMPKKYGITGDLREALYKVRMPLELNPAYIGVVVQCKR